MFSLGWRCITRFHWSFSVFYTLPAMHFRLHSFQEIKLDSVILRHSTCSHRASGAWSRTLNIRHIVCSCCYVVPVALLNKELRMQYCDRFLTLFLTIQTIWLAISSMTAKRREEIIKWPIHLTTAKARICFHIVDKPIQIHLRKHNIVSHPFTTSRLFCKLNFGRCKAAM